MFYNKKRILVTGGHGFLGRHLVRLLTEAGATVFVPTRQKYDLRKAGVVRYLVGTKPDVLFHLAAKVSGIEHTRSTPAAHLFDNSMMALNVIDECARKNVKCVVAGSVCAYPQHVPVPMIEENLLKGAPEPTNASYGAAKRLALAALEAYHEQYNLRCAYLLSANLYGPGDDFAPQTSHVIPALIRRIDEAQKNGDAGIAVWGSGKATRDFLYVEDAARAYMQAGELIDEPTPINIGSGHEVSIAWLVEELKLQMNFQGDTVFDTSKPDGQLRRGLRLWRAEDLLKWQPTTPLTIGLAKTIQFYRETYA